MNKRIFDIQTKSCYLDIFLVSVSCVVICIALVGFAPSLAMADEADRPSVLLIDAGQGDYETFSLYWLGNQGAETVAEEGANRIVTVASPSWWDSGSSSGLPVPATFLFHKIVPDSPTTADDVAWALENIKNYGAQAKVFVVAMGSTGLSLREYAEDFANTLQSSRADLVGMVFCGTPHNGYSAMEAYSELTMWDTLAQTVGLSREDLMPGSPYLEKLNTGSFPRPVKTLNVIGAVGDLGFGFTDGAGVSTDYTLSQALSTQIQSVDVTCTLGTGINLAGQWSEFTDKLNRPDRLVDKNLVERLPALEGYPTSVEVQEVIRGFYDEWFSAGSPVTHISNVIALDLSGSMFEDITPGNDKINSAKNAAREYLKAVQAYSVLSQAAPISLSISGFSTDLVSVSDGYDDDARAKVEALDAFPNETNIGIALLDALERLNDTPAASDKRILLLSDGASTEGLTDEEMLAGPVAQAAADGIVIDAIGFGDVGESNSSFLEQVAEASGGAYYSAQDTYELEVGFIRSYYDSLGLDLVDLEVSSDSDLATIGETSSSTTALSIGLIGNGFLPTVTLLCDNTEIDPTEYEIQQEENFVAIQYPNPLLGEYSIHVSGGNNNFHLFAVQQEGLRIREAVVGEQTDNSMIMLVAAGVVFLIALVVVIVRTLAKNKQKEG